MVRCIERTRCNGVVFLTVYFLKGHFVDCTSCNGTMNSTVQCNETVDRPFTFKGD